MTVLVTGGAGYIGSHVVRDLRERERVVVVDDLSSGDPTRIPGIELDRLDLAAPEAVDRLHALMTDREVDAVVHLAARKQVAESVARPAWYYTQNVGGLAQLLLAMERAGVRDLVYSSSAAVYGAVADGGPVREDHPCRPANPYGETKLVGEWMCRDAETAWDLRSLSLRYFNVAGAVSPELGDPGAANLIPLVFEAITAGRRPQVFGADHGTPDGTCVRDFVHVADLSRAHVAALDLLRSPAYDAAPPALNIGTGQGASVAEVVAEIARATGRVLEPEVVGPRAGDPAVVVSDPALAHEVLGWRARHGLEDMVESAWAGWVERHPDATAPRPSA